MMKKKEDEEEEAEDQLSFGIITVLMGGSVVLVWQPTNMEIGIESKVHSPKWSESPKKSKATPTEGHAKSTRPKGLKSPTTWHYHGSKVYRMGPTPLFPLLGDYHTCFVPVGHTPYAITRYSLHKFDGFGRR